ncbi:MAG: hypothetical protein O6913_10780 [Chloroflexi bacterium]|nr:hypothetical protein [Chloroflexota bacterium]
MRSTACTSASPLRPRIPYLVTALLLGLGVAACTGVGVTIVYGEIRFSEAVSIEMEPLTQKDVAEALFASDGAKQSPPVASEIDWSRLKGGSPFVYGKLRKSRCLWVGTGGEPIVTFDAVIGDLSLTDLEGRPLPMNTNEISIAKGQSRHPLTRVPWVVNGEQMDVLQWDPYEYGAATVKLTRYEDGDALADPYDPCGRLDRSPLIMDMAKWKDHCSSIHPNSYTPFAVFRCGLYQQLGDASYTVVAAGVMDLRDLEIIDNTLKAPPRQLEPNLKLVNGMRTIARPLAFKELVMRNADCRLAPANVPCTEVTKFDDDGNPRDPAAFWRWHWYTPSIDAQGDVVVGASTIDPKDARWEENFSPRTHVDAVRIFREIGRHPETQEPLVEYLAPQAIHLDTELTETMTIDKEFETFMDGETEAKQFHPDLAGFAVTPTYRLLEIQSANPTVIPQKLEWVVEWKAYPDGMGFFGLPPVLPGDDLYLEFDVQGGGIGTSTGGLTVTVSPPYRDMGPVRLETVGNFERALNVLNIGLSHAVVDDLHITGRDAVDFRLEMLPARSLPFVLKPGESFDISLIFTSREYGVKNAYVEVDLRAGGTTQTIMAKIVAQGVDADAYLEPSSLNFWDEPCYTNGSRPVSNRVRTGLLGSVGYLPLHRRNVVIEGPDAAYFNVLARSRSGLTYPLTSWIWIAPGDAEQLEIHYDPPPGSYDAPLHIARLRVETNAGDEVMMLYGSVNRSCQP